MEKRNVYLLLAIGFGSDEGQVRWIVETAILMLIFLSNDKSHVIQTDWRWKSDMIHVHANCKILSRKEIMGYGRQSKIHRFNPLLAEGTATTGNSIFIFPGALHPFRHPYQNITFTSPQPWDKTCRPLAVTTQFNTR